MFQNEELSNILKDIFGDEEEVDAREQEEDDMCDDEGENGNADARGFCLWNEHSVFSICKMYIIM